jgi:hypothetical protein
MVNNQKLHELVLGFYRAEKPIAAICYGVAVLAFARDFNERTSIIKGKHITGHCIEYDYHDGTDFLHTDFNMGPPPYVLEYVLSDAVGPEGKYHGNFGKETSVIVDYPFITACSLQGSFEFGEQFVNVLDKDLKMHGCNLFSPGWDDPSSKVLACTIGAFTEGQADIHLMFNTDYVPLDFDIPQVNQKMKWYRLADTSLDEPDDFAKQGSEVAISGNKYEVNPYSSVILILK